MAMEIKCYSCGHDVIVGDNPYIGICSHCFAEVPLPKDMVSLGQAYAYANELLSMSRFSEAIAAFQELLVQAPVEAAANWGYAVSQYGIEFVQDPDTALLKPTLHRLSNERFSQYLYVRKAIEYAPDYVTQQFYIQQSQQIDAIQSESLQISRKEDPYDVFICYKKTEKGEKRTSDSRIAADLYRELVRRGYKTFFAEETLHVGEEYEPRIFAALNSAKILIAIGSREEYYEAVWVKNEWSRYVDLIESEKPEDAQKRLLIPVFYGITHDRIPPQLRKQPRYVDMGASADPKQVLFGLIAAHFSGGSKDDASDLKRQVRGKSSGAVRMETSTENYLTRGTIALVNGSFDEAAKMFDQALAMEQTADAYLGLMMCDLKISGSEALSSYAKDIRGHARFQDALACATEQEQEKLRVIAETCLKNRDWKMLCSQKKELCEQDVRSVLKNLNKFSLSGEANAKGRELQERIVQAEAARKRLESEKPFLKALRQFLWLGNVIPGLFLVASGLLKKAGMETDIDWVAIPGGLMIMGFYTVGISEMLGVIPFLNGGNFTKLLRIAAGFFIGMGLFTNLYTLEERAQFLGVGAALTAVYTLTYDLWRMPARRRYRSCRRNKSQLEEQLLALVRPLHERAQEAVLEKAKVYQQYFTPDEWTEAQGQWKTRVEDTCIEWLTGLQQRLRNM